MRNIFKIIFYVWLILGCPILGLLVAGGGAVVTGLLLQWLVDLPNHSFWLFVSGFSIMGTFMGAQYGWRTAWSAYRIMRLPDSAFLYENGESGFEVPLKRMDLDASDSSAEPPPSGSRE